jgi:hypothetical protein
MLIRFGRIVARVEGAMPALASMKSVLLAGGIVALAMADAAGAVSLFAARNDGPGGNRADFINDARFENWDVDGNAANGQQAGPHPECHADQSARRRIQQRLAAI